MPISKKRIKTSIILVSLLGFCLYGCQSKPADSVNTPDVSQVQQQSSALALKLAGQRVESAGPVSLYNAQGEACGKLEAKTTVDLTDRILGDFIEIQGLAGMYVKADEVVKSGSWKETTSRLLPLGKTIVTTSTYTLNDLMGQPKITVGTSHEYEVLVDEPERKGVLVDGRLYYISQEEIVSESGQATISNPQEVPVFMYHFFYDDQVQSRPSDSNYVSISEFDEHLTVLENQGYSTLTMQELNHYLDGTAMIPEKSCVITIDDGDASVYQVGYPVLAKHKMNATLFLIAGWFDPVLPYEFIEMRENGIELQSHSFLMHQGGCSGMGHGGRLLCVDHETGVEDTLMSLAYVDGGFVYCYPFGDVNENAKQILQDAGVLMAFTTEYGQVSTGMDKYELPRVRITGGASIERFKSALK